jgi:hypothetical protein
MSKSTDKDIEKYVLSMMPKNVKKALSDAQYDLHYGPGGSGRRMGYVQASKIVNDWWRSEMNDDLVVDDGGNVSTEHEFKRFVQESVKKLYKEGKAQALKEGLDDDEERNTEYGYVSEAEYAAKQSADFGEQGLIETATVYSNRAIKHIVFGSEWA